MSSLTHRAPKSQSSSSTKPRKEVTKRRPYTPHHTNKSFDFTKDFVDSFSRDEHEGETDHNTGTPSESGCIGISLATVMNTLRVSSDAPLPSSPLSLHEEDDDNMIFKHFHRARAAVQKSLSCAVSKTPTWSNTVSFDDSNISFVYDMYERKEQDRSLMQRAASWGTLEETIESSSLNNERRNPPTNRNVQFHYPPITSVRVRPRTKSDDIKELFFAPEELDEIEDDRSDTKAADDIETLAVGGDNWSVPTSGSSIFTADEDDQDSAGGKLLGGAGASNVMFDRSPRNKRLSAGDKRIVRGVQIMLRDKSTGK